MGRPSEMTEAVVEKICAALAQGKSMRTICKAADMPDRRTVERWMDGCPDTAATIARARAIGLDERAEKAVQAAKVAADAVKGRLAFDAERWYLSKIGAKKYGEAALLKHANHDGDGPPENNVNVRFHKSDGD